MSLDDLDKETQVDLFLETNRALLRIIGPEVRAISLDYDCDDDMIYLYVYSERELSEEDKESFDIATTEIISGIIRHMGIRFFVVPMPKELSIRGEPFFQRKEIGVEQ